MRIPIVFALVLSSGVAFAQSQPDQAAKDAEKRIRVEGSTGGLGEITPEEKKGAAAGAGPHLEHNSGAARRDPSAVETPAAPAARGETRGGLESGDARKPAPRP